MDRLLLKNHWRQGALNMLSCQILAKLKLKIDGSYTTADLIKETDYTKVHMTRILDKMEGKRILERKRRGMTNIVVLK